MFQNRISPTKIPEFFVLFAFIDTMKKYITVAALLVAGSAFSNAEATIVTFLNSTQVPDFASENFKLDGLPSAAGASTQRITLLDGTELSMHNTAGRFWNETPANVAWTNSEIITDFNNTLGVDLQAEDFQSLTYVASGAGGSKSTATLDFSENELIESGQLMAFYLVVAASSRDLSGPYNSFSVSGLSSVEVSWARADGTGFEANGAISIANGTLGLIKVVGVLEEELSVVFSSDVAKNGWSMIAYDAVPEPSAFGLLAGLGALVLVGSRRRRK